MPKIGVPPNMRAIRGKNTKPELTVRKLLHKLGFRFRIHYRKLPGKPDIALPKYKAIIMVNGCFWHGHNCHIYTPPKSRKDFWLQKISSNQIRDNSYKLVYRNAGWKTLTVWECAIHGKTRLSLAELGKAIESWTLYDPSDANLEGRTAHWINPKPAFQPDDSQKHPAHLNPLHKSLTSLRFINFTTES